MANVAFQRFIDRYIGGALCLSYSVGNIFCNRALPENPKNILVVRLWTLGETMLTLPMIKKLHEEFPNAKITVLCRNRNKVIFKYVDFVDEILLFERENFGKILGRHGHFDLAIDTEPYLRISGLLTRFLGKASIGFDHSVRGLLYSNKVRYDDDQHCVEIMCNLLRPLGVKFKPEKLVKLKPDADVTEKLQKLYKGAEKIIGMHPSTAESAKYRAWPAENFSKLIDMLEPGVMVVLTGTSGEHQLNEKIIKGCESSERVFNLAGLLSFDEFIALFDVLDAYVSNDTGPMHLSAAQGCKTIGLFGPNLPKRFGPYPSGKNCAVYCGGELPCSPCISVRDGRFKKCQRMKNGTGECMTLIESEKIVDNL